MGQSRCKYCGSKLDETGHCSRPCLIAKQKKKLEELQKKNNSGSTNP